jgi:hypothetical protein
LPIPLVLAILFQKIDDFHFPTIENCPHKKRKNSKDVFGKFKEKLQKTVVLS